MGKKWIIWGALLALSAVALGAFGAHGLKSMISLERLEIFHTGVRYQFYHAFALLFLGLWERTSQTKQPAMRWAALAFLSGVLLFSGSLYLLALRDIWSWSVAWLGPITPLGGLLFMVGWGSLIWGVQAAE